MTRLLLVIIYLAFISLGLPDSLLGVAWPLLRLDWNLPLDYAGLIATVTISSTIVSSFLSGRIISRFGTGKVTFVSCLMTSGALLGISISPSFVWILLFSIPLGFGAGSVDTALNNYVSLHYKSHHMNWLHSFWGVGATMGPLIMGQFLLYRTWQTGYRFIGALQLTLAIILFISLPLWKAHATPTSPQHNDDIPKETRTFWQKIKLPGVPSMLLAFFFYVAAEAAVGLWGGSYLVQIRAIEPGTAAQWIALYYAGITLGRILAGFISFKLSNTHLVFSGTLISLTGVLLLIFIPITWITPLSFTLIGLGFAPVFPGLIHETPQRFGKEYAQDIIGYEVAFAYLGSATLPPLFGIFAQRFTLVIFPFFILLCIIILLFSTKNKTQPIK